MTIKRGEPWGEEKRRPPDIELADSDAKLARLVALATDTALGVSEGDVHRTIGEPSPREVLQRLPMDLLHVEADGVLAVAVAHVVVRGSWWRGPILAVCNVAYIGDWNVAPRAHPNDGRFDVVTVASGMSVRHRWQARTRLALGTHVPHPDITIRTGTEASWEFERPRRVWIDGVEWGEVSALTVTIEPDAYTLYV